MSNEITLREPIWDEYLNYISEFETMLGKPFIDIVNFKHKWLLTLSEGNLTESKLKSMIKSDVIKLMRELDSCMSFKEGDDPKKC